MMTKQQEESLKLSIFEIWETAWRAGYETCKEDGYKLNSLNKNNE